MKMVQCGKGLSYERVDHGYPELDVVCYELLHCLCRKNSNLPVPMDRLLFHEVRDHALTVALASDAGNSGRHLHERARPPTNGKVVCHTDDVNAVRHCAPHAPNELLIGGARCSPHVHLSVKYGHGGERDGQRRNVSRQHVGVIRAGKRPAHVARRVADDDGERRTTHTHARLKVERASHERDEGGKPAGKKNAAPAQLGQRQAKAVPRSGVGARRLEEAKHSTDDVIR